MSNKYRIKPVVVSAIQWTGNNAVDINEFAYGYWYMFEDEKDLYLKTTDGMKKVNIGDYIIQDVDGNFDVCDSYMFEKKYERYKVWDENL